ncbi:MAG TPA: hypothetical protein VLZ83_12400 [Edaphocola sp.]|nr:hypothetical protein [Edaphocola sp.]
MKTILSIFPVILFLMLVSCRFNSSYINREEDKRYGEQAIAQFYELLKNQDYKETYRFFDKRFFEVTDTQKLNEIYDITFEKLGNVEHYNIEKWETESIVGKDPKTNYVFLLNVKRSYYESKETFTLLKEKDEIKIISYYVNSDGLFKK